MIKADEKLPLVLIVGNGFDLCHGAKTSFADFAEWIFKLLSIEILQSYKCKLSNSHFKSSLNQLVLNPSDPWLSNNWDEQHRTLNKRIKEGNLEGIENSIKSTWFLQQYIENKLLSIFLINIKNDWFSIESAYFETLIQKKSKEEIIELNKGMNDIKELLNEYLSSVNIEFNKDIDLFIREKINNYDNILVVNFNYTESFNQYIEKFNTAGNYKIVNIHGTLKNNNIIFGYGNDKHVKYKEIQDLEINEYMTHMKTYEYVMRNDYQELINEVEKFDRYNVFIIGHSLGVTDKTMLKEILGSEKCAYIEFFKRSDLDPNEGRKDMKNKFISLGRIIENEREVRSKVVTYKNSVFFP